MNHQTSPPAVAGQIAAERGRLLLLAGMVLILAGGLYFGWENSPLSGRLQPQQHVETKLKEELAQRFRQGVAQLSGKQYAAALASFQRVLALAPEMPEAHVNIGYAWLGLGNFRAAADAFDTATTLRPGQLNAYYGLAEALQGLGDGPGALQAMETYLHRSPPADPFRRKAEAAAWELRAALEEQRPPPPTGAVPHRRGKGAAE
ncbi:MAG: tetratricopeptide repeat protein [Proteobacteria bacterium]|nr:tetratricopeptide repeat protein [Pseudomonadota bacterium]